MFQQPSEGDRVDMNELVGSLVLFYVHEIRQGINTPYGEKEAVSCAIHILDGAKGGEKFENALIFQGALIGSLRSAAGGEPVLARVGTGTAKPGQKPPFVLNPFTDADAALATTYIQNMAKPFQAPAANGTAAAPAKTEIDITGLDPAVVELLRKTGAIPA